MAEKKEKTQNTTQHKKWTRKELKAGSRRDEHQGDGEPRGRNQGRGTGVIIFAE